jgi:DNA-binding transcriptional regulator LsrR (DeoR family)
VTSQRIRTNAPAPGRITRWSGQPRSDDRAPDAAPELEAEVLRLFHDEGLDLITVTRRTGLPRAQVRAVLRDAMPKQAQRPIPAPPSECAALHRQGLSADQIAARLQVSAGLVRTRLAQAGIQPPSRRKHPVQAYADLANQRWSTAQIARELSVSADTVERNLTEADYLGLLTPSPLPPNEPGGAP